MTYPPETQFVPISQLYGSVARLLRLSALVLALLFVLRVLLSLAPLRSGLLAVTLRFCTASVSQAPLAVLVVCLVGLSLLIDERSRSSRRLARGLRTAALPLAMVYVLLIPVYGTAQWWRARSEAEVLRQGLQTSLQQLRSTRRDVQLSSSSQELQRIWVTLPEGSPPLNSFGTSPGQQRAAVTRFLDQVHGILMARLAAIDRRVMVVLVRDTGLFSLACLGLAALFYRSSQLGLPTGPRWIPGASRSRSRPWWWPPGAGRPNSRPWWNLGMGRPRSRRRRSQASTSGRPHSHQWWWPLGSGHLSSRRRQGRRGPLDHELEMLVQSSAMATGDQAQPLDRESADPAGDPSG